MRGWSRILMLTFYYKCWDVYVRWPAGSIYVHSTAEFTRSVKELR